MKAKQTEAPALEYAQAPGEAGGIHLEKVVRREVSALEQQQQQQSLQPSLTANRLVEAT